jgi:hypothetical protein
LSVTPRGPSIKKAVKPTTLKIHTPRDALSKPLHYMFDEHLRCRSRSRSSGPKDRYNTRKNNNKYKEFVAKRSESYENLHKKYNERPVISVNNDV